ncbi:MAG TPA: hypothetical protein PK297_13295 [Spirochaetota bacterium]|nr:hypothetical protein [Spirochaetota bacterium]
MSNSRHQYTLKRWTFFLLSILILSLSVFTACTQEDDLLPGRAKVYTTLPDIPSAGDRYELDAKVAGDTNDLKILGHKDDVTVKDGTTHFNGPVFFASGTNVCIVQNAKVSVTATGSLFGMASLPEFNIGVWKDMLWNAGKKLFPVQTLKGSEFLDPESEHVLQGGNTNRLPIHEDRTYLLYKIDLSLGGIAAFIPNSTVQLAAEKVPMVPGLKIYLIVDPKDPSFFLTFNSKNFASLEKTLADRAEKNNTKPKLKGIGKLDLLDGFGIGLSARGLLPFRMDYTNLLDSSLGVKYEFGSHIWLKAKIPIEAYGLPFVIDGNAALNLNPDDLTGIDLSAFDLRMRFGINGKLFFNLNKYLSKLAGGATGNAAKGYKVLGALSSLVVIEELAGASAVVEISRYPTIYFSTYAGNPSVKLNLGFLAKIPGLENAGPQIESAVNKMLVPAESRKNRFAGYFRAGPSIDDIRWFVGFHSTYSFNPFGMLNSLAMIPDNIIDFSQIGLPSLTAEALLTIGSDHGMHLSGRITGGFSLLKNISLDAGAKIDVSIRSLTDFSFETEGSMSLSLFSLSASLDGRLSVSPGKVDLGGRMTISLGSLGSINGALSGTYYPAQSFWDLSGSGDFTVLGYKIAKASVRSTASGLWVEGQLEIPNFSTVAVRGSIDFRTGDISISGLADITIKGYKIASATITLGTQGVFFSGGLNIPNLSQITIAGGIDRNGNFSISTRASLSLLGYSIANALVNFDNSGLIIEGDLTIPKVSTLRIRGSIMANGQISISGNAAITVGSFNFANAAFSLSNAGLYISSNVNLLGFMSLSVSGSITSSGSFNISGSWSADSGKISFGAGWVRGTVNLTVSLGTDGFKFNGSVGVSFALGWCPVCYSDSFTLSFGVIVGPEGVGFSYKFPLIGTKTIWIKKNKSIVYDGNVLPKPDNKRYFPVNADQ